MYGKDLSATIFEGGIKLKECYLAQRYTGTSDEHISTAARNSLDVVNEIVCAAEINPTDGSADVLNMYASSTDKERAVMDSLLISICGKPLGKIITDAENSDAAACVESARPDNKYLLLSADNCSSDIGVECFNSYEDAAAAMEAAYKEIIDEYYGDVESDMSDNSVSVLCTNNDYYYWNIKKV